MEKLNTMKVILLFWFILLFMLLLTIIGVLSFYDLHYLKYLGPTFTIGISVELILILLCCVKK
jgi:hypothetical protein